jgi:hypothetical protein
MEMVRYTNICENGYVVYVQGERKLIQQYLLITNIQEYFLTIVTPACDVVRGPWTLYSYVFFIEPGLE